MMFGDETFFDEREIARKTKIKSGLKALTLFFFRWDKQEDRDRCLEIWGH